MKTRMFRITIDGRQWQEPAGNRTALELQHDLRTRGRSVRVIERYVQTKEAKDR